MGNRLRVGDHLTVRARVTHVDHKTCEAEVEVLGPAGVVGRGTFVQRYVPRGRLEGRSRGEAAPGAKRMED